MDNPKLNRLTQLPIINKLIYNRPECVLTDRVTKIQIECACSGSASPDGPLN